MIIAPFTLSMRLQLKTAIHEIWTVQGTHTRDDTALVSRGQLRP